MFSELNFWIVSFKVKTVVYFAFLVYNVVKSYMKRSIFSHVQSFSSFVQVLKAYAWLKLLVSSLVYLTSM